MSRKSIVILSVAGVSFNHMMRPLLTASLLLLVSLVAACTTPRTGFDEGLAAYERGDYATTLKEWRPLAEQGDPRAQHYLGWLYVMGRGVPQDQGEAVRWFRKAAEQGDADAQANLGSLFLLDDRLTRNYPEALKWLRAAADQGHSLAQIKLGILYEYGEGVPQDRVQAYVWFGRAAAQGSELAEASRDELSTHMTQPQIHEAQRLVRDWKPKEK